MPDHPPDHTSRARVTNLGRARRRAAGAPGADAVTWLTRAAAILLLIAIGFVGWAAMRPLPEPAHEALAPVPTLPPSTDRALEMSRRERLLARLTRDNPFDPEGEFWELQSGQTASGDADQDDEANPGDEPEQAAEQLASADQASGDAGVEDAEYDSISVDSLSSITPAVRREFDELQLRGVFRIDGEPVAMIGHVKDQAKRWSRPRRVGDVFDDGLWKVMGIDASRGRVIVRRNDEVNLELRLFPELATAGWSDESTAAPLPESSIAADAAVEEESSDADRTERIERIRRELAEAGLGAGEIDSLMDDAESDIDLSGAGESDLTAAESAGEDPEAVADTDPAKSDESSKPAGVGALLRLLSSNPLTGDDEDADEKTGDSDESDSGS